MSLTEIYSSFIYQWKHTYIFTWYLDISSEMTSTLPWSFLSTGMHNSISEILKEKSLKPSRRSLPCLAQSQTHPINLNHFLSVPLSPEPKPEVEGLSQSISTSCSLLPPQTGLSAETSYIFLNSVVNKMFDSWEICCITNKYWFLKFNKS